MLAIIIMCLPLLVGWTSLDFVETTMKEFGFRLKKKENINIAYTDRKETRYTFTHRIHQTVVIDEYHNGFVEIRANYKSASKDVNQWNLIIRRSVERSSLRDTVYRIFVLGDNK
jgi:hypothetical protein